MYVDRLRVEFMHSYNIYNYSTHDVIRILPLPVYGLDDKYARKRG